jgi:hypothetical protein
MLRAVHDQADGSLGALFQAVRQILIARALPNLEAVKELIALGHVRPASASPFELTPVLIAIAIGLVALFLRRKALLRRAAQAAAESRRRTPEAHRAATVQALLRDANAAAERILHAQCRGAGEVRIERITVAAE